ncbi:hypothetical protein PSACC_01770 [Paramicrosporidium saccamoebae]|uniref:PCI domain-containing protein n=1 Tax=Paramicrosporidium saccamoebae TaxID=1246581 RepID=A0A2H9TL04_9FUNG|nr:hypothetical protein PSACC_01770 [Paramicrosporidium saccamoebae]
MSRKSLVEDTIDEFGEVVGSWDGTFHSAGVAVAGAVVVVASVTSDDKLENTINGEGRLNVLPGLWCDLLSAHLRVATHMTSGGVSGAFGEQVVLVQILHRLSLSCTRWILPVFYLLNHTLLVLAFQLPEAEQQECARLLNKSVTICLTDRQLLRESRKWGAYRMMAMLFRVYFKLDQLNLCGNVLRAVGAADLPGAERYPKAHLVEFKYLLGRYYFVNGEYSRSEAELLVAFEHCPVDAFHNKQLILHYLIPLRVLLRGLRPSGELLKRYGLDHSFYVSALAALKSGDLSQYQELITSSEGTLLRLGTFLLWEKLILFGWRNLVRKIFLLAGSNSRMQLTTLPTAVGLSVDEIACYIANLIERGLVRGYISQEKSTLVLSQKDPFPITSLLK